MLSASPPTTPKTASLASQGSADVNDEAPMVTSQEGSHPLLDDPFASEQDRAWQRDDPLFDLTQFITGFVQLWQVVAILVAQLSGVAKAVARLQDRVSQVEKGQQPRGSDDDDDERKAFHEQVRDLCETVAMQQEQISQLRQELDQQREEGDRCRNRIKELSTNFNEDGKKLNEFTSNLEVTLIEYVKEQKRHADEFVKVRHEMAQKYAVTNAGFAAIQTQLASSRAMSVPSDVLQAGQAARDARRKRILASVAQRLEQKELEREIEALCPLPAARTSVSEGENKPETSPASASGPETSGVSSAAPPTPVEEKKEQPQIDSTETVQPGAVQSTSGENEPQSISEQTVQPGAVSSVRVSGFPKPRQSRLPVPRKSLIPVAPSRSPLSNVSNVVHSVDRAPKEPKVQKQIVPRVVVTPPPMESTESDEESPVLANSPLATDAAAKRPDPNLLQVSAAVDSIAFLDTSPSRVPRIPKPAKMSYKNESLYSPPTRKATVTRQTRTRWI